jgi:uncharacterized protein (TIGR00297 family)
VTYPIVGVFLGVLGLALAIRRGWLTWRGVGAGLVVGAALVTGTHAAGPILLVVFLASSSGLSRLRFGGQPGPRPEPGAATAAPGSGPDAGSSAGDGLRNAWQVLANSAVPGIAALLAAVGVLPCAGVAVAGAIAAVTADTWATEIGTALRAPARLVTTWRRVLPGRSGAVSVAGTAAGFTGAATIALIASYLPAAAWGPALPAEFTPVLVGGLVGLFADSFLGATVEGRIPGINNETVNLIGSLAGAVAACLLA